MPEYFTQRELEIITNCMRESNIQTTFNINSPFRVNQIEFGSPIERLKIHDKAQSGVINYDLHGSRF